MLSACKSRTSKAPHTHAHTRIINTKTLKLLLQSNLSISLAKNLFPFRVHLHHSVVVALILQDYHESICDDLKTVKSQEVGEKYCICHTFLLATLQHCSWQSIPSRDIIIIIINFIIIVSHPVFHIWPFYFMCIVLFCNVEM